MRPLTKLEELIQEYLASKNGGICNLNDILELVSQAVEGVLPPGENAKVELHHVDENTTMIITVPGDNDMNKWGPFTYKFKTEEKVYHVGE